MFPYIEAGPLVRMRTIVPQLHEYKKQLSRSELTCRGLYILSLGLAKKVILADSFARIANAGFGSTQGYSTLEAWIFSLSYTFQLYFDFSGYSDMAIGIGRALGFRFPENFDHPYMAASVRDFWRRWHMTLTRWFRDYLYFPLGGNRCGRPRQLANLVIVFSLCGLWHGASWNFLGWGLFHGFFLAAERLAGNRALPGGRLLGHLYTLVVVWFGWVLFRSESWHQTVSIWRAMLDLRSLGDWRAVPWQTLTADIALAFVAGIAAATDWGSRLRHRLSSPIRPIGSIAAVAESAVILVLFGLGLMSVGAGSHNPFIYYRF